MAQGRPIKLDSRIHDKICDSIRAGNYIETAAAFAGIHKTTLYDWLKRGERANQESIKTGRKVPKKEQPFVNFSNAVEKALAQAEMEDVQRITDASRADWKAAAWRLERKFQDRWGRKHQTLATPEEQQLQLYQIKKMELELEKARLELANLKGTGQGNAHDQIANYTAAIKSDLTNIYPVEAAEPEDEEGADDGY